ncbi:hypothetical protein G9A89_014496 [Geosiphon pyriformis]|nr:hypothetical protein G9A89_014496 [Geosiphon pyriformis]
MLVRVFELAEKEANHSQMVNMIMEENKTETLEKRIQEKIHTNHLKDAARKSATVEIIAHCTRNSEQKSMPVIFANA